MTGIELAIGIAAASAAGSAAQLGYTLANQPKPPPKPVDPTGGIQARTVAADDAEKRRRQQVAAAYGRSNTILTSPLGGVGQTSGTRKTLLGT